MSNRSELNSYIRQLHQRLRLGASLRGVAILTATALATTICLVLILNAFAFPLRSIPGARAVLLIVLAVTALFTLALPLLRLNRRRSVIAAEAASPEFEQRLVTFEEREREGSDPFLELLAADTLKVAQNAPSANLAPNDRLFGLAGAGLASIGVLAWMIAAGPGYLGYGASLIWTGPKHNSAPLYDLVITPGNIALRRNSDQLITARAIGLRPDKARLYARYHSASAKFGRNASWEPVAMQLQPQSQPSAARSQNFQFLLAGIPEDVEYYVQAGPLTSRHFKIRVVDLPAVKQIQVTYRYPKWTGMKQVSEEHGGDLRAIEGTDAELRVVMDRRLRDGRLTLDNGQQIVLSGGQGNLYKGVIHMRKDGAYHVAASDHGQQVRLSEDYFIATDKANPPEIAIDRPGGDYRATPIEEVTVGVKAADEFGLNNVSLHYSVNGGPDNTVSLLKQAGAKSASGATTLSLEGFKLVPGDLVSLYATAKDGHSEARTDITFIEAEPFEREFSQSQQSGGGGGGGQGQSQTDISKREKELIAATWKRQNEKGATAKDAVDAGKFLSEVQTKLRDQVLALAARMDSRDLSSANEEFNSFGQDMQSAAGAMAPSAGKLKQMQWREAIQGEQKSLQYLLRAEATFRKIEVAFGQQRGGGGGGASAGRDLASLFDLELDTQKNQYETAQTGSPADQRAKAVDDALQKLDALARRQEELAQQQHKNPQTMQERWQQEMLRRQAEQLQRQMEQMAQNNQPQNGQQGQEGGQQSSQQSANGSAGQSQSSQGKSGASRSQSQSGANGESGDPRMEQALNRLRQADEEMKRGAEEQHNADASRRAADQLREATNLLSGTQQQQASGKLNSLSHEAGRLGEQERAQADRIRGLAGQRPAATQGQYSAMVQQRDKLADDRQQLSDDLSRLEKNLRSTAREMAPSQPQVSSKLRDALSGMDQGDLSNRVQRTADWLRRGINPNSNGTEDGISADLQRLNNQVRQAQQSLGASKPSQNASQGEQIAALSHLERFRGEIESMSRSDRNGRGQQPGRDGQRGQGTQGGLSQGQSQDQSHGQPGQQGQAGQSGRQGQSGGFNRQGGNRLGRDNPSGDVGNGGSGGADVGTAYFNVNTGNNHFDHTGPRRISPDISSTPPDSEAAYRDGMTELNQLHQLAQNDPEAQKEVQDLVREMQRLDPRRFPGNPEIVNQLHAQVLNGVDRLELQLRHDAEASGQVRASNPSVIPPGYQDEVAEYFRRLSKGQ